MRQELGSSLEASVRIEPSSDSLKDALRYLKKNGNPEVDRLFNWLIVSNVQIGGEPWAEVLSSEEDSMGIIEVSKARGLKCERCWHYAVDIGDDSTHKSLCTRCINTLERLL